MTEIQNRLRKLGGESCRMYLDNKNRGARVWKLKIASMNNYKNDPTKGFDIDFKAIGDKDESY
jgi:hypothetical protein